MKIITEEDLKKCVKIGKEEMKAIEEAFVKLSNNEVDMPPIQRLDIKENNGEIDIKSAHIKGYDHFAVKMSTGFFNNSKIGLPSGNGMIVLYSALTGIPEAIFLDNGYLTDIRTGLAGAIASKYLSRKNSKTIGIIGTGKQARYQLRALKLVRDFDKVFAFGLDRDMAENFLSDMSEELGFQGIFESDIEKLVKSSDILITSTPSQKPYVSADWIHQGLHITAMGSDAEHKQELDEAIFSKTDQIFCDRKTQCFRLGELHHALQKGIIKSDSQVNELGDLISRKLSYQRKEEEITVCDLTGTGVQDTAIANFAQYSISSRFISKKDRAPLFVT